MKFLRNTKKVKMLNMYPMDFEEFLIANGSEELIDEIHYMRYFFKSK